MNKILLVDDNVNQILEVKQTLESHGYAVEIAYDGQTAWRLLSTPPFPDLVIFDEIQCGSSGHEICERIKSTPELSHLPVLIVGVPNDMGTLKLCMESAADAILTMPHTESVLLDKIASIIARYASSTEDNNASSPATGQEENPSNGSNSSNRLIELCYETIRDSAKSASELKSSSLELSSVKGQLESDTLRIRDKLRKTRQQLILRTRAIDSLLSALVIVEWNNENFVITDANSSFKNILGYDPDQLIGKPFPIITDSINDVQKLIDGFEIAKKDHKFVEILKLVHKGGQPLWGKISISPIGINEKGTFSFACVIADVTTDRHITESLQFLSTLTTSGDSFYHDIVKKINELLATGIGFICKTDGAGHATTLMSIQNGKTVPNWSYATEGTPGHNLSETEGKFYSVNIQQEYPDDFFYKRNNIRAYAIQQIRNASGTETGFIGVMSTKAFIDPKSVQEVLKVFAISIGAELTKMRAYQQYEKLFEFAPDAMLLIDSDNTIRLANDRSLTLFGYDEDELLGQPIDLLMDASEVDLDEIIQASRNTEIMQTKSGLYISSLSVRRKDGSLFPAAVSLNPMETQSGNQVVVDIRDITLKIQQEEDRAARQVAEQANVAKSAFLATMSHEIRTPINGIIGCVELLGNHSLSLAQRALVTTVMQSSKTLLHVIDDVLDFSKIEAGKLDVEREPVAIISVLESACTALLPVAHKKRVRISLFADPNIPSGILSDPVRIRQILNNLISNAIKFSAREDRIGRVHVTAGLSDAHTLTLSVMDDGIGMSKEYLEKLFTPFTQEEASTTRRFGGTGLGLSICKNLVKLFGGEISVTSSLGKGSAFTVSLPISKAQVELSSETLPNVDKLNCMIISPEKEFVDICTTYLKASGCVLDQSVRKLEEFNSEGEPGDAQKIVITDYFEKDVRTWLEKVPETRRPKVIVLNYSTASIQDFREADGLLLVQMNLLLRHKLCTAVAIAGGRIDIESAEAESSTKFEQQETMTRESALAQNCLILVAEDNEVNQEVINNQLAALGYVADVAADGQKALAAWLSGDYALLLTDIHMPYMDGYELANVIRKEGGELSTRPVIALTANALASEKARCLAAGMSDYLSKPVSLEQLKSKLKTWLPGSTDFATTTLETTSVQIQDQCTATPKLLDPLELAKFVGNNPESINKHITKYRQLLEEDRIKMADAFINGDRQTVAQLAHRIKSSARMMGSMSLADCCEQIEAVEKKANGELDPEKNTLFADLTAGVISAIDKHLKPN